MSAAIDAGTWSMEQGAPLVLLRRQDAAATTLLSAGVPLGEAARRLGHSVEVLVSTYVGALTGDEAIANRLIDSILHPVDFLAVYARLVNEEVEVAWMSIDQGEH